MEIGLKNLKAVSIKIKSLKISIFILLIGSFVLMVHKINMYLLTAGV